MLNLNYINDCLIEVYFAENNKLIGNFIVSDDGYFYYSPLTNPGLFSSYTLKLISDKLEELNEQWDEKVKNDLSNTDI